MALVRLAANKAQKLRAVVSTTGKEVAQLKDYKRRVPCFTCKGKRTHLLFAQIMVLERGMVPILETPRRVPTRGTPALLRCVFICDACYQTFISGGDDSFFLPGIIGGRGYYLRRPDCPPRRVDLDGWVSFKVKEMGRRVRLLRGYGYDRLGKEYLRGMEQCRKDHEELARYAKWSRVKVPTFEEIFGPRISI